MYNITDEIHNQVYENVVEKAFVIIYNNSKDKATSIAVEKIWDSLEIPIISGIRTSLEGEFEA